MQIFNFSSGDSFLMLKCMSSCIFWVLTVINGVLNTIFLRSFIPEEIFMLKFFFSVGIRHSQVLYLGNIFVYSLISVFLLCCDRCQSSRQCYNNVIIQILEIIIKNQGFSVMCDLGEEKCSTGGLGEEKWLTRSKCHFRLMFEHF